MLPRTLSFRERLDLVADQLLVYGLRDLTADAPLLQWASMATTMRRVASRE